MGKVRLVVFDLAGTTVKDRGEVSLAFTRALEDLGVTVTPDQLDAVRGSSKREAILRFVPDIPDRARVADAAYQAFRDHLRALYSGGGISPIAGAERVFQQLRARGIRVALNTGFDRAITELLLTALGWKDGVADAVVSGDDVKQGRPAPYLIFRAMEETGITCMREVANVGDTVLDLQAAHNAGVAWNIGVVSGAHTRAQLEAAPHTHLLDSVADVMGVWDEMR
jgi:phosphonatase-like hydrolase